MLRAVTRMIDFARGKDDCCAMRKLGVCMLRFAAMCGNMGHPC